MKPSKIFAIITTSLLISLISNAASNLHPEQLKAISKQSNVSSIYFAGNDGEPAKSRKSQSIEIMKSVSDRNTPEIVGNDFTYLKFDVNKFYDAANPELTEMPISDLEYLRFNVDKAIEINPVTLEELPANDFDYLRFNVRTFIVNDTLNNELPVAE